VLSYSALEVRVYQVWSRFTTGTVTYGTGVKLSVLFA
jgi:hypothetical protein